LVTAAANGCWAALYARFRPVYVRCSSSPGVGSNKKFSISFNFPPGTMVKGG
jgi:hypothetical protein